MSAHPQASPFPIVAWLQRRSPVQRRVGVALLAIAGLFVLARIAAGMALDKWWYDTVTDAHVWATKTVAQIVLGLVGVVVAGAIVFGSAWVAAHTTPAPGNKPNRLVNSYRQRMGPAHGWLLLGIALVISLRLAYGLMGRWKMWLLFLEGPDLGTAVPHVGWDLGYHLFRLPFLAMASNWLRMAVAYGVVFAILGYVASGALRIHRGNRRSARRAIVHLVLAGAVLAVLQAFDYLFVRWPSNGTARFGAFTGAGHTQVKFIIPSLVVLAVVAVVVAAMTVRSTRTGRWRMTGIAYLVWAALQLLLILAVPRIVDRFVVNPAEGTLQLPYIEENLVATRAAYSLGPVEQVTRTLADGIDTAPSPDLSPVLDSMPLFSAEFLVTPLQVLKGTTGTRITQVDLDRYMVDGDLEPVFIAARNADRGGLPEKGWVQEHLVYTHGDGVVAVPADSTSSDGRPDVDAYTDLLEGVEPNLYFGENLRGWYAIVGTDRTELGGTRFSGDTAIEMGTFWRRLALSLTVGQVEPLVSAELGSDSQLLYRRDVLERLSYLAPFLEFDQDPYPVVADGRIVWVVDGYTVASTYPYSQSARSLGVFSSSSLPSGSFNYMHAAVKATVDAYDGTVHLYRIAGDDDEDPILSAWESILPGLVEPISAMPESIRAHLMYPRELLDVQTAVLGRYHVTDAETLFDGSDRWAISVAAGGQVVRGNSDNEPSSPAPPVSLFMPSSGPLEGHWVAVRPYGPGSASNPTSTRDELAAVAIADHEYPGSLTLLRIEVDSGRLVSSPVVAQAAIDTDSDLAALFTLLNANGSKVQFGPMTPLLLEDALVWARSIVVTGTASSTAPSLYGVAAVSNGVVGQADETADALAVAVAGAS